MEEPIIKRQKRSFYKSLRVISDAEREQAIQLTKLRLRLGIQTIYDSTIELERTRAY